MRFSSDLSQFRPQNRVFRLVEPIFRAFFIFLVVAKAFWRSLGVFFFYFRRRRQIDYVFSSNVGVHPRRTLCAVGVERIVRIFILAARLFHSQLQIVFSSAESGRISGQADLHIFRSERQGSGDPTPCGGYPGPHCWVSFLFDF